MAKDDKKDDLEAVRILVEALTPFENTERDRIIRWACEKLGVPYGTVVSRSLPLQNKPQHILEVPSIETEEKKQTRDIKSFIEEKNPQTDKQLSAVVAYYYAFEASSEQKKSSIDSKDLIEACRLAQKKRPTNPGQTLINAAHTGYLDKAEETGKYKLNAVGENLVAMTLPSGVSVKKPKNKKITQKTTKKRA